MLFNIFKRKNKVIENKEIETKPKTHVSKPKKVEREPVTYKIYSVPYNKQLIYAEAMYENVLIRTVVDTGNSSQEDCLELSQKIIENRFGQILKEAHQHNLCSFPINRCGGCSLTFKWDNSEIADINLSEKKINLICKISSQKCKGGLSECYVSII